MDVLGSEEGIGRKREGEEGKRERGNGRKGGKGGMCWEVKKGKGEERKKGRERK